MAKFGLDNALIKQFKKELVTDRVRLDQGTDFFFLPQFDAIYRFAGEQLKESVASRLSNSSYAPRRPVEMEVPKHGRISATTSSVIGPNYFRPGSVPWPDDRMLYHFIGQEACFHSEKALDRSRVYSNVPKKDKGSGFVAASLQWTALKEAFAVTAQSKTYKLVLKSDLAQYFFSINQHELINQLEHQGLPTEIARMAEKFFAGLTLDRSSRGIMQGCYASDVLGNGYLLAIDEFISQCGLPFYRYVDDVYVFFETSDQLRDFFPKYVKLLRDYDLSLNESKTFIAAPAKLLKEETELDQAIKLAKAEAIEKLTGYEEIEVDGEYDDSSYMEILETPPDEDEVELHATNAVFKSLEDFKGEERDRAEAFCLGIFRRAHDPRALDYVCEAWMRRPDRAREYALYMNRFSSDDKLRKKVDQTFVDAATGMIDYQWAWAAAIMRRMKNISPQLLAIATSIQADGKRHEVIRSLLTYPVCRHGSAPAKKAVRDGYAASPILMQLAVIHSARYFVTAERNALLKSAEGTSELHTILCAAVKEELKAPTAN